MDREAEIAAVLLAGGKSRRMGFDKIRLNLDGQSVARMLIARLLEITNEVMISANNPLFQNPAHLPVVADVFSDAGPLAGIHAAFLHTRRPWLLVLACDLPCVTSEFLRRMSACRLGYDAVIPVTADGGLHPTCALYHRNCRSAIERNLNQGRYRVTELMNDPVLRVHAWASGRAGFADFQLMDINTPEDYQQLQNRLKS